MAIVTVILTPLSFFLWFCLGALAVSIGNTAASRLTDPDDTSSTADKDTALLSEEILQMPSRLVSKLLVGSKCNQCREPLQIWAVIPIIGIRHGCKECDPGSDLQRTLRRYSTSEAVGGVMSALVWLMFDHDAQSLAAIILISFLCSFAVSLKEQIYSGLGRHTGEGDEDKYAERITNYYLAAAFALTGIGLAVPIAPAVQIPGVMLYGWVGWLVGLWYVAKSNSATNVGMRVTEYPVRCFAAGLIVGAWFGIAIGGSVVVLLWGFGKGMQKLAHARVDRWFEERLFACSVVVASALVMFVYYCPSLQPWEVLGIGDHEISVFRSSFGKKLIDFCDAFCEVWTQVRGSQA